MSNTIRDYLGAEADSLLGYTCKAIPKESLHLPGPDFVDRVFAPDRNPRVLANLQRLFSHGRLAVRATSRFCRSTRGSSIRRGVLCPESGLLRPREHRQAGESRVAAMRVASTFGVLGVVAPQVRSQDSVSS